MSRALVPEPEVFRQHKAAMERILEKVETELHLFQEELTDCTAYILEKIRECEEMQEEFEQMDVSMMGPEDLMEFRRRYEFNRSRYYSLFSGRDAAFTLRDQKMKMDDWLQKLKQHVDSSNRAIDIALARYENAR